MGIVTRRPYLLFHRVFGRVDSIFVLFFVLQGIGPSQALDRAEGRYSFSLTTFDPVGKLGQVERALEAAAQGTPIVGIAVKPNRVLLAAPQVLPSPLMQDDGTTRFSCITPEICVAHSGIAADGRVVVAEAQRLAVEHEYTFDEDISIELLLEELSLLFQEYTMKAGARPFGTTLLVAYNPRRHEQEPCFYRIDPSGTVTALGNCAVINGNLERTNIRSRLADMIAEGGSRSSTEESRTALANIVQKTLEETSLLLQGKEDDPASLMTRMSILTACLSSDGHFSVRRHKNLSSLTDAK
jgi:20S proteasome alpha/beta subunit